MLSRHKAIRIHDHVQRVPLSLSTDLKVHQTFSSDLGSQGLQLPLNYSQDKTILVM